MPPRSRWQYLNTFGRLYVVGAVELIRQHVEKVVGCSALRLKLGTTESRGFRQSHIDGGSVLDKYARNRQRRIKIGIASLDLVGFGLNLDNAQRS